MNKFDKKDNIITYKNIYDHEDNRQVWKEYNEKLHRLERENRIFNNNIEDEEYIIDYKDEDEYWNEQIKEWRDII